MKRLTAIVFLLLLLFNLAGYQLWFYYVQQQADTALVASLDKNRYDSGDLVEIRVPLALPYQTDWADFERVNGEIEIGGVTHKYVKRKVAGGELVLLCLPDHAKSSIQNAETEFFKRSNSLNEPAGAGSDRQGTAQRLNHLSLTDFDDALTQWMLAPFNTSGHAPRALYGSALPFSFLPVAGKPPKA